MSEEEKTTFLYVKGVSENLKRAFKTTCTRNGVTMKKVVSKLMREYINKEERK
jgi:hypothetical protein